LLALTLHANNRLRCWPSTALLCKETGFHKKTVVEARDWLIERKAIRLVPHAKREGDEIKLPQRQFVYQLTGMIETDHGLQPYLNMTPEAEEAAKPELSEGVQPTPLKPVNGVQPTPLNGEIAIKGVQDGPFEGVQNESSLCTPKGFTILEDSTKEDQKTPDTPTAVGGDEKTSSPIEDEKPVKPVQPHIAIIDAWYDGLPAPPISRKYPRNVTTAKRIAEAGYTPAQVKACTQAKYTDSWWAGKQVKLEQIEDDLPLWIKSGATNGNRNTPARRAAPHPGVGNDPTAGTDGTVSEPESEALRRAREWRDANIARAAETAPVSDV